MSIPLKKIQIWKVNLLAQTSGIDFTHMTLFHSLAGKIPRPLLNAFKFPRQQIRMVSRSQWPFVQQHPQGKKLKLGTAGGTEKKFSKTCGKT